MRHLFGTGYRVCCVRQAAHSSEFAGSSRVKQPDYLPRLQGRSKKSGRYRRNSQNIDWFTLMQPLTAVATISSSSIPLCQLTSPDNPLVLLVAWLTLNRNLRFTLPSIAGLLHKGTHTPFVCVITAIRLVGYVITAYSQNCILIQSIELNIAIDSLCLLNTSFPFLGSRLTRGHHQMPFERKRRD